MLEAPALTGATSQSWCALRGATALPAHDVAFADPGIARSATCTSDISSSPLGMRVASAMKSVAAARTCLMASAGFSRLRRGASGKSGVEMRCRSSAGPSGPDWRRMSLRSVLSPRRTRQVLTISTTWPAARAARIARFACFHAADPRASSSRHTTLTQSHGLSRAGRCTVLPLIVHTSPTHRDPPVARLDSELDAQPLVDHHSLRFSGESLRMRPIFMRIGAARARENVIGRDKVVGVPSAAALDGALHPLIEAVKAAPAERRVEAEVKLDALKAEAAKGEGAKDGVIADLVDGLVGLVPAAASAVVSAFATPILGGITGPVTEFVLGKLRAK